MRVGILNSGGDCPGLNAVIHGVVGAADKLGWEVVGFREGFEGVLAPGDYSILSPEDTFGILKLGGTILGSTNKGNFSIKGKSSDAAKIPTEVLDGARKTLDELDIGALIVVGGDGSLTIAQYLFEQGFPIIGVPKTIDNDLAATAMTFGFDSAVSCVVDAMDRLHTTAQSHRRVMVVETMGRHAGWIALWGGIAGGANVILLPEIDFSLKNVADCILQREKDGKRSTLVVVAEGAKLADGELVVKADSSGGEVRLGGIGEIVASELEQLTGQETRACTLGHLQRGGAPTSLDRILGARFGVKAVELAKNKDFGKMVSYQSYSVASVPITEAIHKLRRVEPDSEIVQTARSIGICLGDSPT